MNKKLKGFTLAEILIVIGIIGVVAALTIPTLMTNMKGIANRNKFKKAVATFSQAARMSQAKYGFDYAGATHCNSVDDKPEEVNSVCALWNGTLTGSKGYESVDEFYDLYEKYGSTDQYFLYDLEHSTSIWALSDGTLLHTTSKFADGWGDNKAFGEYVAAENCTKEGYIDYGFFAADVPGCTAYIDVNGPEGPNKIVECTKGSGSSCVVANKDITDMFYVVIHDGIMEPASDAARYVMNSAK